MFVRTFRLIVIIAILIGLVLMSLVRIYIYNNLHYDDRRLRRTRRAKYREKQVVAPGGAALCYVEGPDNGPPLLLIHDNGCCWEDYDSVLPGLARQFHVFAVDCFGHGGSADMPRLYSCANTGDALLWFMEQVIGDPCLLAGHGTGGVIAAWLAANAPEWVTGLAMENAPFFHITPAEMVEGEGTLFWLDSCQLVHDFLTQRNETDFALYYGENCQFWNLYGSMRERVVEWLAKERCRQGAGPVRLPYIPYAHLAPLYYLDRYDLRMGEAHYAGYWSQGLHQEQLLRNISCPTLYLRSKEQFDRDGVLCSAVSAKEMERVSSLVSHLEVLDFRCSHSIHGEKSAKYIAALEQLAKSCS